MKWHVILGGAILAALMLTTTHGAAYLIGRADERAVVAAEQADNTVGATRANDAGEDAVARADADLTRENARLNQELNNARASLRRFENIPTLDGAVGPRQMVHAGYGRALVRCLERLRVAPPPQSGDCAAAELDRAAGDEPLPARPPAGP